MPVLIEPDIHTLQIDDRLIEPAITPRTRAILLVHLYGRCAYTPSVGDLCQRYGLQLIEDNAQAHGCCFIPSAAQASPLKTGSLGHAAAHSFYPTKNLGAFGDAGAVTTNDDDLASTIRALGNYGSSRHYVFDHLGRNSRIDELQAAILDAKLSHLDAANNRRKTIAAYYQAHVQHPHIVMPTCSRDSVFHIFPVLSPRRDALRQHLSDCGIETEIHYPIPPHKQVCYRAWNHLSYPLTEQIAREELSLPLHPAMTDAEVVQVTEALNAFPQ